ncbi:unnamed protein product [Colias eurytheme]|nr:unnamed protein product [Colias eurytheme]
MENSFFEYRDQANGDGESSCEIDDSIVEESFAPKKTPAKKNVTVFVPESDDSVSEGESDDVSGYTKKSLKNTIEMHITSCSDEGS